MTDAGRREQIAREVSCHINNRTRLRESLVPQRDNWDPQAEEWKESWRDVADYILQREAAVLKVAEAAHDMLRDHRFIGEQTQGYRTIEVFGRSLAKLQVALEAWKQGRTP